MIIYLLISGIKEPFEALAGNFGILRKYSMKLNPEQCAFGVGFKNFLGFLMSIGG